MISGYLGRSTKFEEAVSAFAASYADQVARDHQALVAAVKAGRIRAIKEPGTPPSRDP